MQPVFWAEGDDDASRLTGIPNLSRLSLSAYLLLHRHIIVHPAYTWQSDDARELILPDGNKLMTPGNISLVLGDSTTVDSYIVDRMNKLRPHAHRLLSSQTELRQYLRHQTTIKQDAACLDGRFVAAGGVHGIGWSRDKRLRELIRLDLADERPFGCHLRSLFQRCTPAAALGNVIGRIESMTHDLRRLVSVDSVIRIAVKNGFPKREVPKMDSRLHILHWMSHKDDCLEVPLLGRTNQMKLDPSDPIVFWNVFDRMFGSAFREAVTREQWQHVCNVIDDLRQDVLWKQFVDSYFDIVSIINGSADELADVAVYTALTQKYPTLFGVVTQMPISKLGWLSIVCTILAFNSGMDVIAWGGAIGTLGDAIFVGLGHLLQELGGGRSALKARIQSLLTVHP